MTEPDDREMAARLLRHGLSIPTVSSVMEMDFDTVLAVADEQGLALPDAELADVQSALTRLSAKLIEEMLVMLDESSPTIKTRLLIGMFGKLVPIINTQANEGPAQMREAMFAMFEEMQSGAAHDQPAQPEVGEDGDET